MTSHYFECSIKSSFATVFEAVSKTFGNVYSKKLGDINTELFLGDQWFFRVNSDVAILITVKEVSPTETKLKAVSCARGAGLLACKDSS